MTAKTVVVRVAENGRMVLPASVRAELGIKGDTRVTLTVEDVRAEIHPMSKHIRRAKELYQAHATNGRSVDEFLQSRRSDEGIRSESLKQKALQDA